MRTSTLTLALLFLMVSIAYSQPILSKWQRNTDGKKGSYYLPGSGMPPSYTFVVSTDSADAILVAYTNDSVWLRSHGMTDSMGKYLNPGACGSQNYTHRFPRTSLVSSTKSISPKTGQIGILVNGIPIYGLSNAASWNGSTNANNGSGIWNVEVGRSEGFVLDTTFGAHPQQAGAYHSHTTPFRLYTKVSSSQHSPLVGYAFDGYPVYGPYGYSVAINAASAVARMKTGYSLRNITTRTTLPYGVAASQTGPAVSTTYPLGTYCEDYEWLAANGGDLDKYNGRFCVTPEYPAGTYAYFVTVDAAGVAAFPYYIGIEYYGVPVSANFPTPGSTTNNITIPPGATIYNGSTLPLNILRFYGEAKGTVNMLYWQLAANDNSKSIYLQRSSDGINYSDMAVFTYASSSQYDDKHPLQRSYYRLKFIAATGEVSYSTIVTIANSSSSSWLIYPTLTNSIVYVDGLKTQVPVNIAITDASGRKVLDKALTSFQQRLTLDVSYLNKGLYFISIESSGNTETRKIVKQ